MINKECDVQLERICSNIELNKVNKEILNFTGLIGNIELQMINKECDVKLQMINKECGIKLEKS
jgi:hypothetical protein